MFNQKTYMRTTYAHLFEYFMIKYSFDQSFSQNRTFYSLVRGLVCHPDSTLHTRLSG